MEQETLATELLRQLKSNARRWFIIAMVELGIIAILVAFLFIIPVETYTETEYSQEVEDIEDSDITQHIGDEYGESKTDGN